MTEKKPATHDPRSEATAVFHTPTSATSPADIPTTVMSHEEVESALQQARYASTDTQIVPISAPSSSDVSSTQGEASTSAPRNGEEKGSEEADTAWPAPCSDQETIVVDPLEAIRSRHPWSASPASTSSPDTSLLPGLSASSPAQGAPSPDAVSAPPAVWSASATHRKTDPDAGALHAGREGEYSSPHPAPMRSVRPTTLLWGVILAVVGTMLVIAGFGVHIDSIAANVIVLVAAGLALLLAAAMPRRPAPGVASAGKESRASDDAARPTGGDDAPAREHMGR